MTAAPPSAAPAEGPVSAASAEDPVSAAGQAPVAPGALPLLGHGLQMLRRPLRFLSSLPGQGPVVRVELGPETVHVVNDAALARSVLVGEAGSFDQGRLVEKAKPLLGEGIGMLSGEKHLRHRRIMQPAFQRGRIAEYAPVMSRIAAARAASWADGQEVSVTAEMDELSLATVASTLFSADLAEAAAEIRRSLPVVLSQLPRRAMGPALLLRLPTPANRAFDRAVARLHRVIDEAITATRTAGADGNDLISALLTGRDPETGERMSESQIHDQLVNNLVAGTETTGATLAWIFHELGRSPEAEAALHTELDEVLAGRPAAFEDLPRLDVTRRVVQEVLRLYPPYLIMRHSPAPITLGGFALPADAALMISPYVLHRDPALFPDPERFDPDRWLPGHGLPRNATIPFGTGARQCPGNHFALTGTAISLATIAATHRLRPVPGAEVTAVARGAAVHPSTLPMRVERRS